MCCLHLSYASFHIFSAARSAYDIFSSYKYLFVNFKLVFFSHWFIAYFLSF